MLCFAAMARKERRSAASQRRELRVPLLEAILSFPTHLQAGSSIPMSIRQVVAFELCMCYPGTTYYKVFAMLSLLFPLVAFCISKAIRWGAEQDPVVRLGARGQEGS
eukprot:2969962-Rhodomonas_salina.1